MMILFSSMLHANEVRFYVVVKGDSLSSIALSHVGKPVYSKNGSLKKLLEWNPSLKNEHLIFAGQKIRLGHFESPDTHTDVYLQSFIVREVATEVPADKEPLAPQASAAKVFSQPGELGISTGFEFTRVDAKDKALGGTAAFITDMSPKLVLSWVRHWTESWAYYTGLSLLSEKVTNDTATPALTIQDASGVRKKFEFGFKRTWSGNSRTDFGAGFREQLFAHTPTATSITMDRIPTGYFRLSHEQTLFRIQKAMVFGSLGADYLLGAKASVHTTEPGYASDLNLGVRDEFSNFTVETKFNYGISRQNSNLVEAAETHLGFTLGLSWRFDR